jgi:hypothetical protein
MLEQLPKDIICAILRFLVGDRYLSLLYVNKLIYTCVTGTQRDYIRNHFITGDNCTADWDEFICHVRGGIVKRIANGLPVHIRWKHLYIPITVMITSLHNNITYPAIRTAVLFVFIGHRAVTLYIDCTTDNDARTDVPRYTTYAWKSLTNHIRYVWMLTLTKKYLPELYRFITSPLRISSAIHQ